MSPVPLTDCITRSHPISTLCANYRLSQPTWGDEGVFLVIAVGITADGHDVVMAGACGDCPVGAFSVNGGQIWERPDPGIADWAALDGLGVPHSNLFNCTAPAPDDQNCTAPVGQAMINIPPP